MTYAFISTMRMVPWGGSETLWAGAARELLDRKASVLTRTTPWPVIPQPLARLETCGAKITFDRQHFSLADRALAKVSPGTTLRRRTNRVRDWLSKIPSPRVIVSCGSLLDDFSSLANLSDDGIPYAVIIQAAGPEIWPPDAALGAVTKLLCRARHVFFVSRNNREDVQCCIGQTLTRSEILPNPANLPADLLAGKGLPAFPADEGLCLACVARLDVIAKGQDLLLHVLAREKWRERKISLTLYGEGPHRAALENMVRHLGLAAITFAGQVTDIASVWSRHHLGVLPSRFEGLPLSIIEAMMLGRANVVPATCGSAELVDDGETGFIASAPTVHAFDEALERAWQRRGELAAIGAHAAVRIRELIPDHPGRLLAARLEQIFASDARAE